MIDYGRLNRSLDFYEGYGIKRIEVPWTVTKSVSDITRPEGAGEFTITEKNKVLVASAEQGFLYLQLKGFLAPGRYQAITPCFRDESFDETPTKYFMKNEIFVTDIVNKEMLDFYLYGSKAFFEEELGDSVTIVTTAEGFDLEYRGMEIGSYGIRSCSFANWIYATGCAEPRMTVAKIRAKRELSLS